MRMNGLWLQPEAVFVDLADNESVHLVQCPARLILRHMTRNATVLVANNRQRCFGRVSMRADFSHGELYVDVEVVRYT